MASATATTLLTLSLLLSLSSASTLLDAAEILSTSGFESMALHLELASQTLESRHSLTIFAPTDFAFRQLPRVPLSLLRYHLLPHAFSLHSLTSLPSGAAIPTLLPRHSLTVTTTTTHISLNNVTVNPSPIFHDPRLAIFATHNFFNPRFRPPPPTPAKNNPLLDASRALRSRGFSLMASVLDVQLPASRELTLLAPGDEAVAKRAGNLSEFPALLRRHLVPRKVAWRDLAGLKDGTLIGTYERGFAVNVTKSGTRTLLLNGVPVVFRDMYRGDWLVVHGLRHVLSVRRGKRHHPATNDSYRVSVAARDGEESSEFDNYDDRDGNSARHYHFSVFH
ncbi:putative fasciclin arabinogalactan protein 20 [Spatholobus suberectus]|nr:putative fasciclin arabinogalactan protein 20 [Spatholobus suberectus]